MSGNMISGSGAVAELIRQKDWSQTPLGPIDTWSPALRTSLSMALAVPTPVQLLWGEQMTVLYNDPFIPILNHKHPVALGSSAREVWAEVWASVGTQLEAVMAEGHSFSFRDLPLAILDHEQLTSSFFTFTYSPIRDSEGRIVGLLNLTQDTTAAVQAQQLLERSEHRFRTLIQSASVGIAIGNTAGELTYLNPALSNMLNYTAEEVAQRQIRWDRLTPPQYLKADLHAIEQLKSNGIADPYEKAFCTKQGVPVPLLIGASVLTADQEFGENSDIAVFATDLRKQKRAEEALLQTEKLAAVGKLASSISHEINNPLEAVTNLLYIVQSDPSLSQSARDFLGTADRELARMSQITSQTLRFHRQSTRAQRVEAENLLDEVVQLYAPRLRNFGIEVERQYGPDASLTCYEGDIRQVINNLVSNAIDAMRTDGGRLCFRTRAALRPSTGAEGVLITIADNGSGIAPAARKHIFDAFYTTKGIHGTGLGLWISCRIVHKHRGYIRCFSSVDPVRHGTVLQLWLPKTLAPSAKEAWHETEVRTDRS